MNREERDQIWAAAHFLEAPPRAATVMSKAGAAFERPLAWLGGPWLKRLTDHAVSAAYDVALKSLPGTKRVRRPLGEAHVWAATALGGAGGLFGFAGLWFELPTVLVLILRSILEEAKQAGFDPEDPEIRVECLTVFALGAPGSKDDEAKGGYFATRLAWSAWVREVARGGSRIAGAKLLSAIAVRVQSRILQMGAAQLLPVVGAAGGAILNYGFSSYYRQCARHHFALRKLERLYGTQEVQREFESARLSERKI